MNLAKSILGKTQPTNPESKRMTTKSEFTPGPWRCDRDGKYGAIVADGDTGHDDADTVEAYGGHLICESVSIRNRPLIIAAPDLLEACKAVIGPGYLACKHPASQDYVSHEAIEKVRAAIKKATT